MNLKAFHVLFISAATLLALLLGGWCLRQYMEHDGLGTLLATLGAFAAGAGLVAYGTWFLKKVRPL